MRAGMHTRLIANYRQGPSQSMATQHEGRSQDAHGYVVRPPTCEETAGHANALRVRS